VALNVGDVNDDMAAVVGFRFAGNEGSDFENEHADDIALRNDEPP
jgi:hypothetical protein